MAVFLDVEEKDILHTSFLRFVRADFTERVESFYKKQMVNGIVSTYLEFPIISNSGKESWIGQTVEMIVEKNEVKEVLAVACDVTEKIRAQQFSSNSEEKYRSLIENIKLGLMEVDLEQRILFANRSFCEITGYSLEEMMGKNADELFIFPEDSYNSQRIGEVNQERLNGESSVYELKIRRKNGKPVWMIISGAPVRNSDGEIVGSVGIHNDITERKAKEMERKNLLEELKESETKLRAVVNSALDAVIIINEEGVVQEWNPRASEIFGYKEEIACGQKMTDLIIHQPFKRIMEMGIQAFTESPKAPMLNKRIEIQSVNNQGKVFPAEFSIVPVNMSDRVFYSAFVRDITHEKKINEEMMNALNREKELNEMKSRLVSMASHEFRTPLTTIQTNIELLSYHLEREKLTSRSKVSRNFDRVNSQIKRLNVLTNDVLMIGRIESGQIPNTPAYTDIIKLFKHIIQTNFTQLPDERTVDIHLEGKPKKVFIDPNIYTHIISNLLSNAFKYSPDSKNPELWLRFKQDMLQIDVIDSGIGISERDLPHIFDSFFRSDNAENIQGTGLGLAIVKEFCEMQGALIAVESRLCWGSTFTIMQPYSLEKNLPVSRKDKQVISKVLNQTP